MHDASVPAQDGVAVEAVDRASEDLADVDPEQDAAPLVGLDQRRVLAGNLGGSIQRPSARISSTRGSSASAAGTSFRTMCLPANRATLPGPQPT